MSASTQTIDRRYAEVRKVLLITLGLNLLVAALKLIWGYHNHIVALQADGFHSIFDALANVVGLVAMSIATRPPDPEHPYGHQKLEVAASTIIGIMVLLGLLEVGRGIYAAITTGQSPTVDASTYGVVIFSIFVSLGVSVYEHRKGKALNSMILKSDAAHTLSDSLAAVAVLVGILLIDRGIPTGDVIASVVVMTFIGMTAYRVLRSSIDVMVDTAHFNADEIQQIVEREPGVLSCHFIRSRGMAGHAFLEFHMSMSPATTLEEAGVVMLGVKEKLAKRFPDLEDVLIQLEPHKPEHVDDVPEQLL